jgi:hypothetical protein
VNTVPGVLLNGHRKQECYVTLQWKALPKRNTSLLGRFVSYKENSVVKMAPGAREIEIFTVVNNYCKPRTLPTSVIIECWSLP